MDINIISSYSCIYYNKNYMVNTSMGILWEFSHGMVFIFFITSNSKIKFYNICGGGSDRDRDGYNRDRGDEYNRDRNRGSDRNRGIDLNRDRDRYRGRYI
eukprot:220507_1